MKKKLEKILEFFKVGSPTKRELAIYSTIGAIAVVPAIAKSINLPPEIAQAVKASAELTTETNTIDIYLVEPGVFASSFYVKHEEGAHERVDPLDGGFIGYPPPCVDLSSSPYPYDTPLSDDTRNKESTLPIYMSAVLRGIPSSDSSFFYFEKTGYEHRNLTIQEVDPLDPENPDNPNPIYDIRDIIDNQGGILSAGTFEEDVVRMFRVGVYTNPRGDMDENGQVDIDDLVLTGENWAKTTHDGNDNYVGNNYDVTDRNHDGWTDFVDFAIMAQDWYKTESGDLISKVTEPGMDKYQQALREANIKNLYGDKVQKVRVLRIARVSNPINPHGVYDKGLVQLAQNNGDYQPLKNQKPLEDKLSDEPENPENQSARPEPRFRIDKNGKKHYRGNPNKQPLDNRVVALDTKYQKRPAA